MTQEFWGDRPPNSPDSPQWWALSSALLRLDGLKEEFDLQSVEGWTAATERILDGLIDIEEMSHAAQQRAFRSVGAETMADVRENMHDISLAMSGWIDGFVTAILAYERLKELKEAEDGQTE